MGLDFISEKDKDGAGFFVIHNGNHDQEEFWQRFIDELKALGCDSQTYVYSVRDKEGEEIRDFYDLPLESLPHAFIVRDNDEITNSWYGSSLPSAEDVCFILRQIG